MGRISIVGNCSSHIEGQSRYRFTTKSRVGWDWMWEFAGTIAEALIFLLHFRMIFGTDVRVVLLFCMF